MVCPCPPEEHRAVYEGRRHPVPGRYICALCGEFVETPAQSTDAYRASASSTVDSHTPGSASTRLSQSGRVFAATDIG
jgi:hypothetical protein